MAETCNCLTCGIGRAIKAAHPEPLMPEAVDQIVTSLVTTAALFAASRGPEGFSLGVTEFVLAFGRVTIVKADNDAPKPTVRCH